MSGVVKLVKKGIGAVGKLIGSIFPKPPAPPPLPPMPKLPPMPAFHMPSFSMPEFKFPEMPSFDSPAVQAAGSRETSRIGKASGRKSTIKTSEAGVEEDEELGLSLTAKSSTSGSKGGIRKKTLVPIFGGFS